MLLTGYTTFCTSYWLPIPVYFNISFCQATYDELTKIKHAHPTHHGEIERLESFCVKIYNMLRKDDEKNQKLNNF